MPVPQSTIELVDQLHDFIMFLLEDGLMRYDFQQPMFRGFVSAVARLDKSTQLEDHESRVLGHLLLGKTYDQIADTMKLSVNTVRKYITSIYKKAGVHSLNELYAKYFMPWSW
jgi:DNA-binding CsgD family transcriptional regulator